MTWKDKTVSCNGGSNPPTSTKIKIMDYTAVSKEDIKNRARSKAFAKITMLGFDISNNKAELASGEYGGITRDEMILILECNKVERKVWNYITELIEKSDK